VILCVHIVVVVWYRVEVRRRLMISVGIVVAAVCVLLAVAFWPQPKEPEYQGKKLSEWLSLQLEQPRESAEAVSAIGAGAIPFLVRWVDYRIPTWKRRAAEIYARHPGLIGNSFVMGHLFRRREAELPRLGFRGFVMLGERASNAVPRLGRIVMTTSNGIAASLAANSLAYCGPRGGEALATIATNMSLPAGKRGSAALALRNVTYLGTNAAPCVIALLRCSCESNRAVRNPARVALSLLTRDQGLPVVGMNWTNAAPDPLLRRWAMRAAIDFATNSDPFIFELISNGTNDPDPAVQAEVVRYLDRRKDYLDSTAKHE
jgi:hypothetical protein